MNPVEIKGKADALKAKIKRSAGDFLDDEELHDEGVADVAEGDAREAFRRLRRKIGDAIRDAGKVIKG